MPVPLMVEWTPAPSVATSHVLPAHMGLGSSWAGVFMVVSSICAYGHTTKLVCGRLVCIVLGGDVILIPTSSEYVDADYDPLPGRHGAINIRDRDPPAPLPMVQTTCLCSPSRPSTLSWAPTHVCWTIGHPEQVAELDLNPGSPGSWLLFLPHGAASPRV